MPGPRNEAAAVAIDGKIYVRGGSAGGDYQLAKNEVSDPTSDRWQGLATLPKGMNHFAATELGGTIYEFGGFTGSQHKGAVEFVFAYEPKSDKWRPFAPPSSPRGSKPRPPISAGDIAYRKASLEAAAAPRNYARRKAWRS